MSEPQSETPRTDEMCTKNGFRCSCAEMPIGLCIDLERELSTEREAKVEYLRRDAERNSQLVAEREARVKAERERDDIRETMRQCEGPQGWVNARHEDYIYLFNGREKLRADLQEMTRQYGLMCTLRENANAERDDLRRIIANDTQTIKRFQGIVDEIDCETEGSVDGAPDRSAVSSLCNRIQNIILQSR